MKKKAKKDETESERSSSLAVPEEKRRFAHLEGELKSRISDEIKEYSVALDELNRGLAPVNIRY